MSDESFLDSDTPRTARKSSRQIQLEIQAAQREIEARDPESIARRTNLDQRNTDKYYRARESSVFAHTADGSVRPNSARPVEFRAVSPLDERNTDRYYRDRLVKPPTKQQLAQPARSPRRTRHREREERTDTDTIATTQDGLLVETRDDVLPGAQLAAELVHAGPVRIPVRDASLASRLTAVLDGMVGRGEITEDQRRDITLVITPNTTTLLDAERTVDPDAFLAAESVEEDGELPDAPAPREADADEDDDFLGRAIP